MNDTSESELAPAPAPAPALQAAEPRLRLWPAVVILVVQWTVSIGAAVLAPATSIHFFGSFMGPMIGSGLFLLWWLAGSRAPWADRLYIFAFTLLAGAAVMFAGTHPALGFFKVALYAAPLAMVGWCSWLLVAQRLSWPLRREGVFVAICIGFGLFVLVRIDGVWGNMDAEMSWRWSPTLEEKFLAERAVSKPVVLPRDSIELVLQPGDWPEFRGPQRDGRLSGVKVATDWSKEPPKKLWSRKVGPGWSSFAVIGKHVFTQEQWAGEEAIVCYHADHGSERWQHVDPLRFSEPIGGVGPRATPTFHAGKLYVLGATGMLNCLDAATGDVQWSRDIAADAGAKVPQWGFASSPLVFEGKVSVFAGGPDGKSVAAYDAATGALAWAGGKGTHSYSSPQHAKIAGVEQVLSLSEQGLSSLEPTSGALLWNSPWDTQVQRAVQPARVGASDFLLGSAMGHGIRRIHVSRADDAWRAEQVWESTAISPYYNDFVIHENHLYGFDGNFLTCVELEKGKRRWKERGYGNGQLLLLADQGLLLVLAESGEVALVAAKPDKLTEIGRFQAIEGKTWNHPVLAHGRLFVRNSEQMACFEMKLE